jgi:hypothetical protein
MSDPSGTLGVTRLLGLGLTSRKLRGLQRICNEDWGTLTMVATDQNSSMISNQRSENSSPGDRI